MLTCASAKLFLNNSIDIFITHSLRNYTFMDTNLLKIHLSSVDVINGDEEKCYNKIIRILLAFCPIFSRWTEEKLEHFAGHEVGLPGASRVLPHTKCKRNLISDFR
jgi:hypothetical protein